MNRNSKVIMSVLIAAALTGGVFATNLLASSVTPGTNADPLVTKSYVDNKFAQTSSGGTTGGQTVNTDAIVSDVIAQIEFAYGDKLGETSSGEMYKPVSATAGQVIVGHEGAEIILRSGSAVSYCPGENGVVNITSGKDLFNSDIVKANHLLIIPRSDGRGVKVTSDAWFLIKGGYDIIE